MINFDKRMCDCLIPEREINTGICRKCKKQIPINYRIGGFKSTEKELGGTEK